MTQRVDITIIGAGVIGLAVASAVADKDRSVFVLERHDSFGQETSSRNSEVIHAGMYYPKNSLKANSCIEGNGLLYEFCEKNGVRHKKIGKIIVACDDNEVEPLKKLYQNGINNGVELRLIEKAEIKKMEPNVEAVLGIYSPATGIIDSHGLMKRYAARSSDNGAQIVYGASVKGIEFIEDSYKITVLDSSNELFHFETRILVNCAGLESDMVAEMAGIDTRKAKYDLKMCKGVYFKVGGGKSSRIRRLVYPVPDRSHGVLGIHATLDTAGQMKLGPDSEYISRDDMNYDVDQARAEIFFKSVKPFLPFVELEDLSPDTAGIRPKLHGPDEHFRDFVIEHEEKKGLPGLINLIGIESPGLTASPYIARYVADIVDKIL